MFLGVIYGRSLFCCGLPVVLLSDLAESALDKRCVIRWTKRYIIISYNINFTLILGRIIITPIISITDLFQWVSAR